MVVGHLGQTLTPVLSPVGQGQYSDSAPVLTQHRRMEERNAKDRCSKDTPVIKDRVQWTVAGRLGNRFPPARQPVAKLPTLLPGAVTTQLHKMEGSHVWGTLQIPSCVETFLSVQ